MAVLVYSVCCASVFALLQWGGAVVYEPTWWAVLVLAALIATAATALAVINVHQQSDEGLRFKVPWVPFVPALSIAANLALMTNLNPMTWIRFGIWMILGKDPHQSDNGYSLMSIYTRFNARGE